MGLVDIVSNEDQPNHLFPYPSLQDTDYSFPQATYRASLRVAGDNHSLNVSHQLVGANFIAAQIESGRAMFGCIASSGETSCRKLFLSTDSNQTIKWDHFAHGRLANALPIVVGVKNFSHIFTKSDQVDDTWIGKSIYFPKGARLASLAKARPVPAPSVPSVHDKPTPLNGKKRPFAEFDSKRLAEIRSALVDKSATDRQVEFIREFCTRKTFEAWVRRELLGDSGISDTSYLLKESIFEKDFTNMPRQVEKQFSVIWKNLTPGAASRSSFWGVVTTHHILKGVIEPSYLAAKPKGKATGLKRIEDAIAGGDKEEIDKVTRTILRRFCGLGEARGFHRSIRSNCSFARAWWRERMIKETVHLTGANEKAVACTLHKSPEFWEKVDTLLSQQGAAFGDEKIRAAFICALSKYANSARHEELFVSSGSIDRCRKRLSIHSVNQEFGAYEIDDLVEFMTNEIVGPEV